MEREGNEEALQSYDQTITIDLISNGVRQKGKLANQKTVINFRENARDRLSYWLANRLDQLGLLTLSGISYAFNNDGSARTSGAFAGLSFAPSGTYIGQTTNRGYRITSSSGVYNGLTQTSVSSNANTLATDVLTYQSIVDIVTKAKTNYIKPLTAGGKEYYCAFVRPEGIAQLKKDQDFQRALVTGLPRGEENPFFSGGMVTIDGLVLHEHRLVFNTKGAASGSKWGSGGTVDGSRMLVCGAQALGFADLGAPEWSEKLFNYDSSPGINVDKMVGFLKPQFYSIYNKTKEDFGVMTVDHAI